MYMLYPQPHTLNPEPEPIRGQAHEASNPLKAAEIKKVLIHKHTLTHTRKYIDQEGFNTQTLNTHRHANIHTTTLHTYIQYVYTYIHTYITHTFLNFVYGLG